MKRIVTASSILIIVIGICIGELFLLKNTVSNFKNDINAVVDLVKSEELDRAIDETNILIDKWNKKHSLISTFIDHEPLKEIEIAFSSMKAELEQEELEEFFIESERSLIYLENLNVTEQPLLGNIL